jgi:hypothetical protein
MTRGAAATRRFSASSRAKLTHHDLGRFPGSTLFDLIGRVVAEAECLPRKELYEAWEVARRARRWFRGGRVIDLAAGHGLLAHVMLLLDDSSPDAVMVDTRFPASAARLREALVRAWPRLEGRVATLEGDPDEATIRPSDVVVSCHACGALTDRAIDSATRAQARLAVLPCCHDTDTCDTGGLTGWMDASLAIDAVRVLRLQSLGYRVRTQVIPASITPKNRLILAEPERA